MARLRAARGPGLGEFVPAGAPLVAHRGPTDTARLATPPWTPLRRDWSGRSTRTSPTASGCSSTWPSGRCPTRRSSTRPPRCKHRPAARRAAPTGRAGHPRRPLPRRPWQLRLTVPAMDWDAYVHLAFDEIRLAGAGSPQVTRRLIAALDDLLDIAPDERKAVLLEQLDLINEAGRQLRRDERDTDLALSPDPQGIGVAVGTSRRHAVRRRPPGDATSDGCGRGSPDPSPVGRGCRSSSAPAPPEA